MEQNLPTCGEMERSLSQYIQSFYRNQLGCYTGKISSHILNNQVAIIIENSITPLERLLHNSETLQFVKDLRDRIDTIVKQELRLGIETILRTKIVDLTINTTLDHNFTGIIVLLAETPHFRSSRSSRRKLKLSN